MLSDQTRGKPSPQSWPHSCQYVTFVPPLLPSQYSQKQNRRMRFIHHGSNQSPAVITPRESRRYRAQTITCNARNDSGLMRLETGLDMEVIHMAPTTPSRHDGDKPPIIFVPGSKHAAWCYYLLQQYFAEKSFHTYSISMRGLGGSVVHRSDTQGKKRIHADTFVEDINAFLSAFSETTAHTHAPILVAHSIGGYLVQKWAHSQRMTTDTIEGSTKSAAAISAMIFLASAPPGGNSKLIRRVFMKVGLFKSWRITKAFITDALTTDMDLCREVFFSAKDSDGFDEGLEGDDKMREYMERFGQGNLNMDTRTMEPLAKLDERCPIPVLSIGGTADMVVDDVGAREVADFWNGDGVIFDGAPHELMLYSKWRTVADVMHDWLSKNVLTTAT